MNITETAEKLAVEITSAVRKAVEPHDEVAILFSGGVDSALLAAVSRKFSNPKLYVVGFRGSPDLTWGTEAGQLLDLPVTEIVIDVPDIELAVETIVRKIGMRNPEWMTPFVPLYLAMEKTRERTVLCGQGADELFGGYRKYRELPLEEADKRMASDLDELMKDEITYYRKMASHLDKQLEFPFLEPELLDLGRKIPIEMKLGDEETKIILRRAASCLGLPENIALRKKKAVQYGTRVSREMRKMLKKRGKSLDEYIDDIVYTNEN